MLLFHISILSLLTTLMIIRKPLKRHEKLLIAQLILVLFHLIGTQIHDIKIYSNNLFLFLIFFRLTVIMCHGQLFFLYIRAINGYIHKLPCYILMFLPATLHLTYLIIHLFINSSYLVELCKMGQIESSLLFLTSNYFFLISYPIFILLSKPKFNIKEWKGFYTYISISIYLLAIVSSIFPDTIHFYTYFPIIILLSVLYTFKYPHLIYKKKLLKEALDLINNPENDDIDSMLSELDIYINKKKPFLNENLTLSSFAEEVGLSQSLLSSLINNGMNLTFPELINNLRLDHFISTYKNKDNSDTIISVAKSSGFPSKATFYRVFKAKYKSSPKDYLKQLQ